MSEPVASDFTPLHPPPGHGDGPARLQRIERELSEFSYIVSHDLAQAIRHLTEFSSLLTGQIGAEASETQAAYAGHVRRAGEKCAVMMDQLLAFSRAQQRPLTLKSCESTRAAQVAALQLSGALRACEATITIAPLGAQALDIDLMTDAFKYAFDNSLKFRTPGTAPQIVVTADHTPDLWVVRIADNGIGVALERQEKLFRMFYQDFAEGEYPGVGAGLALCRRILRRHGGDAVFLPAATGAILELSMPRSGGAEAPVQ